MATISQTKAHATEVSETEAPSGARVVLRLRKPSPRSRRHVTWREDTVDNEHLNRLRSNCCCVYVKPRKFGESSSDSEEEDLEHCRCHVERRQKNKRPAATDTPPASRRHVTWDADTVDNENTNKRKFKCCCIFEKQREFGESSSDSEADDCTHCRGHKEARAKKSANDADEPLLLSQFMAHGGAS
nr:E3 ubiquitin-protein ligase PPP1R11-like [Rhipicephalus microplus]